MGVTRQSLLGDTPPHVVQKFILTNSNMTSNPTTKPTRSSNPRELCARSEPFRTFEMGVPESSSTERKLSWLRSQIIGDGVEFDSPFGRRRLTYADHTASGRSLQYLENFVINNVLPFYGNTHTSDSHVGGRTTKMFKEATEYIKKCLGGSYDDAIIFTGSGTTSAIKRLQEAMGIAIPSILRERALKCLSDEEQWVVFVGPYEHHSNILSWRESLAEVVEIGVDGNGLVDIDGLQRQLESRKLENRPVLGSFSACSNVTGIVSDTRKIARILHQHGGFACFDFAASGPYVEIDMRSGEIDGYDAVFLSPHKFLGGPGSPGVLLMNKALYQLKSSPPSTCGGGTVAYVNGFNEKDTLYLNEIEDRENGGTPPVIQTIRAALSFWVKEDIGYEAIQKREQVYVKKALERLLPNKYIRVLGNTTAPRQAILSFLIHSTVNSSTADESSSGNVNGQESSLYMWAERGNKRNKPLHGPFVAALLNDLFGIQARGGCACAGPYGHILLDVDQTTSLSTRSAIQKGYMGVKPGWTRISFPYYMSNEEFEFIIATLEFVAIYGQRFLPLYKFSWKTGGWSFKKNALKDLLGKDNINMGSTQAFALATKLHAMSIQKNTKDHEISDCNQQPDSIIIKYASYLELAKHVANLLPKFPPARKIPDDLDPDIVYFRV